MGLCQNLEPTNAHEFTPVDLPISANLVPWSKQDPRTQNFLKSNISWIPTFHHFPRSFPCFSFKSPNIHVILKVFSEFEKAQISPQISGEGDEACSLSQTLRTPSRKFSKSIAVNCERKRLRWHEQSVGESKTSMVIAMVMTNHY